MVLYAIILKYDRGAVCNQYQMRADLCRSSAFAKGATAEEGPCTRLFWFYEIRFVKLSLLRRAICFMNINNWCIFVYTDIYKRAVVFVRAALFV